jgi:zinc transporter ZupT
MVAVMMVVGIEMFFALRGAGHVHATDYDSLIDHVGQEHGYYRGSDEQVRRAEVELESQRENGHLSGQHQRLLHDDHESSDDLPLTSPTTSKHQRHRRRSHSIESLSSNAHSASDLDLEELDPSPLPHPPIPPPSKSSAPNPQKQLLQCLLLEAGILFHSIFIGMALSVATGASFIVLLVAISFHQTFEGFALGARISSLIPTLFPASSPKPWLMALAYGATTPLGQALGLGLHNLYDPASATGLIMVGLTNAFSSGLLLFAGLVELLAEDFLSDRSYETLRGKLRLEACGAVAAGAFLMAAVGAFA